MLNNYNKESTRTECPLACLLAKLLLSFHHHRNNHRAAMRLLVEVFAERMFDLVLHKRPIRGMAIQADKRIQYTLTRALKQFLGVAHIDEAARDDIGARDRLSRLFIDGQHRHQNAILGQHLAIAQHNLTHITNTQAIYKDIAAAEMVDDLDLILSELDDIAILRDHNILIRNTQRVAKLCVQHQLTIFTMNRHEELRSNQAQHQLQLFLSAMTGDVHIRDALIEHLRALAEEAIDRAMHHLLVARYRRCREDHRVARLDTDLAMVLVRDTRQGRSWLALAAGTDDHHLLGLELIDILDADKHAFGNIQVAKLNRHLHIVNHTATDQRDKAIIASGGIDHLLHTRDQRGKSRQHNATGRVGEDLIKRIVDHALRWSIAGRFDAGAITHHHKHALVAEATEHPEIGRLAIDRCIVELIVARVDDISQRRADHKTDGIGNAMIDAEELDHALTQLQLIAGRDHIDRCLIEQPMFLEFDINQALCQARRIDGREIQHWQNVRQSANVIFMTVSNEDTAYTRLLVCKIARIGNNQVDTKHFIIGEHHPGINNDNVVTVLNDQHILSDLSQTSEREKSNFFYCQGIKDLLKPHHMCSL